MTCTCWVCDAWVSTLSDGDTRCFPMRAPFVTYTSVWESSNDLSDSKALTWSWICYSTAAYIIFRRWFPRYFDIQLVEMALGFCVSLRFCRKACGTCTLEKSAVLGKGASDLRCVQEDTIDGEDEAQARKRCGVVYST